MGASKIRTAQTMYGDIPFETVVCDSCGTEIRKEDARQFVIGEIQDRINYQSVGNERFKFDARTVQIGWACEYCREQGVFGFPESSVWDIVRSYPEVVMTVIVVVNLVIVALTFLVG